MAAFAELERDIIHQRTMAGLAAARAQGRVGGRPSVMNSDKLAAVTRSPCPRSEPRKDHQGPRRLPRHDLSAANACPVSTASSPATVAPR